MFIDASAIVAILGREPGHEEIEKRLAAGGGPFFVSPLVRFEAALALARQKTPVGTRTSPALVDQAGRAVAAFASAIEAREIPVTAEIGDRALAAGAAFGKVVGHAADLNFGDCFAYACAKALDVALIYKGADFAQTDLA